VDTIRFSIKSSTFICIQIFEIRWKSLTCWKTSQDFGWNTDFRIANDLIKTFYSKARWDSISLNGFKSELRWLSRFQEMDEKVKIARGDHPVKENLYSGGTLTCSCSVRQGKLLSHRAALSEQASSRTTLLSVLRPSHRWSLKIGDFIGLLVSMESTNFET